MNEEFGQKVYGFGYDELHDDYKILRMYTATSHDLKVELYSLKNDSWRRVDDFPAGRRQCGLAKLLNGKLHWVSSDGPPRCNEGDIISFDEKWGKLTMEKEEIICSGNCIYYENRGIIVDILGKLLPAYYDNDFDHDVYCGGCSFSGDDDYGPIHVDGGVKLSSNDGKIEKNDLDGKLDSLLSFPEYAIFSSHHHLGLILKIRQLLQTRTTEFSPQLLPFGFISFCYFGILACDRKI
ncbi:hypothetical protein RND71_016377 [Anisodus tanguticus]|uniref:F-box associated beta-propeller type 1 domain-containing protein n=1 Tax=Anisodus tanguticus TaxID=243964 RepID=A0AAE1VL99_9SOLA|nr:hypothetical protein RND71_016377 [Anisodus tanguticus]